MKISLIVPVYNVRDLLPGCIASIRAQTFADFECILVDDGSTDGSGALSDELAAADVRFCVIHQPNGGLSAARNAGIDRAQGAFVAFADSDDRLPPRALEVLLAKLRADGVDVAVGNVLLHDCRSGEERLFAPLSTPRPRNVLDELFNVSACNKLYRREVFSTRRFEQGATFEDVAVWADILFSGARIGYVDETVYVYNVNRAGSIVTVRDYCGYPAAWTAQREALRAHGRYDARTAADFADRIALKFIQAYALSSPPTRREFYLRTQAFFRASPPGGCSSVNCTAGGLLSAIAAVHRCCCRRLPYGLYRLLFGWERIIAIPKLNAALRRRFQQTST